jgi:hypothetical protein
MKFLAWLEKIPMQVFVYIMAAMIVFWLGSRAAMSVHRCPVCPDCPELVARSHVERDSIVVHDTVRVVKYAPSITRRTVPAMPTVALVPDLRSTAEGGPPDTRTPDSAISYEVIDTMPDHAIIGFSIASRELPDKYLPDLAHTAWYLAKPDRIKIISDTLTIQMPALKCPARWGRDITVGGICIGVGALATAVYILR